MTCPGCGQVVTPGMRTGGIIGDRSRADTYRCNRCQTLFDVTLIVIEEGLPDKIRSTREWLEENRETS